MNTSIVTFHSFNKPASGRLVSGDDRMLFVNARNPHGGHNLVVVEDGRAILHGNVAALAAARRDCSPRLYRRLRRFLALRGIARDWVLY